MPASCPNRATITARFQVITRKANDRYIDPDAFLAQAPQKNGSWWPEWAGWLNAHSGQPVDPPSMGGAAHVALADAPGSYVLQQ